MPFRYFCETKYRGKPRGVQRIPYPNFELRHAIGKINLPYFHFTSKCIVNSWIQKLDTYFQLNPMDKRDAIKMATLHLDGESNDWWFHGMNTLSHWQVVTYA